MRLSNEIPPIFARIRETFGVEWDSGVLVAWDGTIHCKHRRSLADVPAHLRVHESVHFEQQKKMGVAAWWDKYLTDAKFRLKQEVEAYQKQADFARRNLPWGQAREIISKCIDDLCGPMYGGMVSREKAERLIPLYEKS